MYVFNIYICNITIYARCTWLLQKKSHGHELLEQVFYHLDILEKDYFGLQYTDHYNVNVSSLYMYVYMHI